MYIYGQNFIKSPAVQIVCNFDNGAKTVQVTPIYKNPKMLAFLIPDMGEDVPVGAHSVGVEVTLNGQSFTECGLNF